MKREKWKKIDDGRGRRFGEREGTKRRKGSSKMKKRTRKTREEREEKETEKVKLDGAGPLGLSS